MSAMQPLSEWLNRKKSRKPRKKIKAVSAKRAAELRIYTKKRKEFLERYPWCQAWSRIHGYVLDNGGVSFPRERATEVHHMAKRTGTNYLDETTWLAVSRRSHEFIHRNLSIARKLNLLK